MEKIKENKGLELTDRKVSWEFISHNICEITLEHNGFRYGNAHSGGFVSITFEDKACTFMEVNGKETDKFTFTFRGCSEREMLIESFRLIIKELEKN